MVSSGKKWWFVEESGGDVEPISKEGVLNVIRGVQSQHR